MSITVVGTIGIDSLYTPFGDAERVLGGSAAYFALAASFFDRVNIVAVAGTDINAIGLHPLQRENIDITGIDIQPGETFRWGGRYHLDLNTRDTLFTELGVLATFQPKVPAAYHGSDIVFLANLTPAVQESVVQQIPNAKLRALDTMNFWIEGMRDDLVNVMRHVDIVIIAEEELRQFAGISNLRAAARSIFALGPQKIVVKLGTYGSILLDADGGYFAAPAFPLDDVRDPTGAGDSFAGGFLGVLAERLQAGHELQLRDYKRALYYGNIMGSFTCEDFGVQRLLQISTSDIAQRYRNLVDFTHFESRI